MVYVGRLVIEGRLPTKIGTTGGEWNAPTVDAHLVELTATVRDHQTVLFGRDGSSGLSARLEQLWVAHRAGQAENQEVH